VRRAREVWEGSVLQRLPEGDLFVVSGGRARSAQLVVVQGADLRETWPSAEATVLPRLSEGDMFAVPGGGAWATQVVVSE
jgi:hypothetical protein